MISMLFIIILALWIAGAWITLLYLDAVEADPSRFDMILTTLTWPALALLWSVAFLRMVREERHDG